MGVRVSPRLEARVRRDFEAGSVDLVLVRLAELDLPGIGSDVARERIHAAVVLLARGRWAAFEQQALLAQADWRDVLVSAGLADDDWPQRLDEQLGAARAS